MRAGERLDEELTGWDDDLIRTAPDCRDYLTKDVRKASCFAWSLPLIAADQAWSRRRLRRIHGPLDGQNWLTLESLCHTLNGNCRALHPCHFQDLSNW